MRLFLIFFLILTAIIPGGVSYALPGVSMTAVEFPEGLDWLNTDQPLTMAQLKGKFVLLDFWTYACINCMHIIPDLKQLEEKYPNELVVIGVHSAKFKTERNTQNIKEAILRYKIDHPVVNDPRLELWRAYNVNAWPTVTLIDPDGKIVLQKAGEGVFKPIDLMLERLIPKSNQVLNRAPLHLPRERDKQQALMLDFPGKVLADEQSGRLFIADSGHNRIVVANLNGTILDIIGSGQAGRKDGAFEQVSFRHPQGMALQGNVLFIADTENHLIRRADLSQRTVETFAGTGVQGNDRNPKGVATQVALSSPWDVLIAQDTLFIAMAGLHQLWAVDLISEEVRVHAGSGRENIIDGPLLKSALAQPSGLATDGQRIYFADSEVSAVRSADIDSSGEVTTIIGQGLFDFGDVDGDAKQSRLQHCLGVEFHDGVLYVADTYNNKIKVIDPINRISRTFAGTGESGSTDGESSTVTFNEPGGISYAAGAIYIADTNNQQIRVLSLESNTVSTLVLQ